MCKNQGKGPSSCFCFCFLNLYELIDPKNCYWWICISYDFIGSWKNFANHIFVGLSAWISWNHWASYGGDSKVHIGQLDEWNTQILSYPSSCKVSWKSTRTSKMRWRNSNVDGYLCSNVRMQMYFALYGFGIMLSLLFSWLLDL